MQSSQSQSGFTLIEILIVITIIAILAAVLIPNLTGARKSGEKNAVRNHLAACLTSAEQKRDFHSGEVTLPGTCEALIGTGGVTLSTDQITLNGDTYTITLKDLAGDTYTETLRKKAP